MLPLGDILSCLVLTAAPTVIAEIVFREKGAAEKCIAQYNGQRADGELMCCMKREGVVLMEVRSYTTGYLQSRCTRGTHPGAEERRSVCGARGGR